MNNMSGVKQYTPEIQDQITTMINTPGLEAVNVALDILVAGIGEYKTIYTSDVSDEIKTEQYDALFKNFITSKIPDVEQRAQQFDSLNLSVDTISQKIFSHLFTNVGLTVRNQPGFGLLVGLYSQHAGVDEVAKFFQYVCLPYHQPLMDQLKSTFSNEILEQYPPVGQSS